ncbi:MAG: hypothetical protein HDR31_01130 [Mycoplasma sp.]|nr:hypothetical protein [Mycoplasma sp.]
MFNKKNKKNKSVFDDISKENLDNSSDNKNNSNSNQNTENNFVENKENISQTNFDNNKYSPNDANSTFFEKFEKSKKDINKDKKKQWSEAKKSMGLRNKVLGFENRLRDDIFIRKIWIILGIFSVIFLAYSSVVIGFLGDKFNGANSDDYKWTYVNYFLDMNKTTVVFSGFVIALIPLPYIYLLAAWFIGINSVHRSKPFIVVLIIFLSISLLLTILIIPMSSIIFANVNDFRPITS